MRKLVWIFIALAIGGCATPKNTAKPTGAMPPANAGSAGVSTGTKPQGPKPYKDIITDKAVTQKGLFIVHRVEDKYFFELNDSI